MSVPIITRFLLVVVLCVSTAYAHAASIQPLTSGRLERVATDLFVTLTGPGFSLIWYDNDAFMPTIHPGEDVPALTYSFGGMPHRLVVDGVNVATRNEQFQIAFVLASFTVPADLPPFVIVPATGVFTGSASWSVPTGLDTTTFSGELTGELRFFQKSPVEWFFSGGSFLDVIPEGPDVPPLDNVPVPEPTSLTLLGTGLLLAWRRRRG